MTNINQILTIFVPVTDQDRALEFYVNTLGFEKRADFLYSGGNRWIEVAPPDSSNAIALVPQGEGKTKGNDETRCALVSKDIEADHAALLSNGVDVDTMIAGKGSSRKGLTSTDVIIEDPVPAQFCFRDPDGNRFLVVPGN